MMKKKRILGWILAFFGLLGFVMVYGGAIGADFNPDAYKEGLTFVLVGLIILCLVVVGIFFLNRLPDRPMPISWDERRKKVFRLKL